MKRVLIQLDEDLWADCRVRAAELRIPVKKFAALALKRELEEGK